MNVPKGPKNPTRLGADVDMAARLGLGVAEGAAGSIACHHDRMDETSLRALLDDVQTGAMTPDAAVARLRRLPFAHVDGATVDHHRHLRQGLPEAIYGPG